MRLAILSAWPATAQPLPAPLSGSVSGLLAGHHRDLTLDVVINGREIGLLGDFTEDDGVLSATRKELEELGFHVASSGGSATDARLPLGGLAGVSYRKDERTQTIYFTASAAALEPTRINARAADQASTLPIESGIGAIANYDVALNRVAGQTVAEGQFDVRTFSPFGVAETSFDATSSAANGYRSLVRLDTTYTYADPDSLRRIRAGDVIEGGLAWTRPVRLGGVQLTTDFSLRPDLVTFPVPTIAGQVAVPSSIDVLANGVQLLSRDVPPGPFEIRQLPVVLGASDVSVVTRDAIGGQSTRTLSIYASDLLLAPGRSQYSAELGSVRLGYGLMSDDYSVPAASLTYRRGVLDWLTLEGHAEGTGGGTARQGATSVGSGAMGGGGVALAFGQAGVISLDAAASQFGGSQGGLASVSFERITHRLSLAGSITATTRRFNDTAAAAGDRVPRVQARASVGFSLGRYGSVGLAYVAEHLGAEQALRGSTTQVHQSFEQVGAFGTASLTPAAKVSILSASYSAQILRGRAYVYATGFHDFAARGNDGVTIGLTFSLGRRTTLGGGGDVGDGRSIKFVEASQSAEVIGDTGWQVQAEQGAASRQLLLGQYKSPVGLVEAQVTRTGQYTALRGDMQGAIATLGGGVFASNPIHDSFAVVDTGKSGIEVLQENRPIGRTDASGRMLVPDLRSFGVNRLGIDPTDVPIDAEVGQTERLLRPGDRSGLVVRFRVSSSHGAMVHFVDMTGVPLAVGSTAVLKPFSAHRTTVVGYDGVAYLTRLLAHNTVVIVSPAGKRCTATFGYRAEPDVLPQIGPVPCRPADP